MTVKVQLLRSTTASKRPNATSLLDGELALNTNNGTPGAYFEDSAGNVVKIGPAEVGSSAPNASPAAGGIAGNSVGELWYDTANAGGNSLDVLKVFDGTSFVSAGHVTIGTTNIEVGSAGTDTLTGLAALSSTKYTASEGFVAQDQGYMQWDEQLANGTNYVRFTAPDSVPTNITFKLPGTDGQANYFLSTDGAGNLTFIDPAPTLSLRELGSRSIDDLSNVDIVTNPVQDGQILEWDAATSTFIPGDQVLNLVALTGLPENTADLGVFTGDVITDGSSIKSALQQLETYAETVRADVIEVHNATGSALTKGQVVYVTGTHASGKPTVELADADGVGTVPAIGLVHETILAGQDGKVTTSGVLEGVDTSTPGFTAGDSLYLSTTPGVLTATRPSGDTVAVQKVGIATRINASAGSILVIGAGRTNDVPNELTALTGVARLDVDLGTFTGVTIADNSTIKSAFQQMETAFEEADQNVDDLITLSGVPENSVNLGIFTGDIIADNQTTKAAIQDLETYVDAISLTSIEDGGASVRTDAATDSVTFGTTNVDRWQIDTNGDFIPQADSTYDIGALGAEVAQVHADEYYGTLMTANQPNITGTGTITSGTWEATIIDNTYGGTGLDTSAAQNGELLIGNGSGLTLTTLTEGQSMTITNGPGSITLSANFAQAAPTSVASNAGVASFHSTYFTADAQGWIEPVGNYGLNNVASDVGTAIPVAHGISIVGDTGITTRATGSSVSVDLDDTAVTPAVYGTADTVGTFTVDQQGRLTNAANVTIDIVHTQVNDFDAGVRTNRLDQMAAPTAPVSMNGQRLTDVADPSSDTDAANKGYVDSVAQGLDVKGSARAGTTGPITLTGTQTIDGVVLNIGDRVLVKDQTNQAENGIYEVQAGAWNRTVDADTWESLISAFIFVEEGTLNEDNGYVCTIDQGGSLGTSPVTWEQFSGAGQITAGTGLTKNGNTIDANGTANRIVCNADTIDIASTYVGQTSITTLGTITTGTWNADIVGTAFGGTGQDGSNMTANYVLAAPDGANGNVSYRLLVADDISSGTFDGGTY